MMAYLAVVPHLALLLAGAPILAGLTGSGFPAQPWRDARRLFRKPGLWPEGASVLRVVPVIDLGASLLAALLVPSFTLGMATAPLADVVLIGALLAGSRASLVLGALDADDGRAALAAQRLAVLLAACAPGLLVLVLLVAAAAGTSNLDAAGAVLREAGPAWTWAMAAAAACVLLLASAGPDAAMDAFAGRDLAVLQFARQLRRVAVFSILATLLLPFGLAPAGSGVDAWIVGAACWTVKIAVLGVAYEAACRLRARLRGDQAPELAVLGLLLALIAAALFFAGQRAA